MDLDTAPSSLSSKPIALPGDSQDTAILEAASDPNISKRPRDAHTLHLILHQYGVHAYQERVPLQLMDLAYRYTSGILQDSLHLTHENYPGAPLATGPIGASTRNSAEGAQTVGLSTLRLAIRSRTHYQYNAHLPKEFYQDLGNEKNKIALPPVQVDAGLQLPPEQYLMTSKHWEMGEEYEVMENESLDTTRPSRDEVIAGIEAESGEEPEGGSVEDLFGRAVPEDENMED